MLVLEVHVMPKMKIEECVLEVHVTEMEQNVTHIPDGTEINAILGK